MSRAEYMRNWRRNRTGTPPHGTLDGYVNWRCRCDDCKAAHELDRDRRSARRYLARFGIDLDDILNASSTSDVNRPADAAERVIHE